MSALPTFFLKKVLFPHENTITQKRRTPDEGSPSFFAGKEIHPLLRLGKVIYGATRPKPSPPFEKGGRKL